MIETDLILMSLVIFLPTVFALGLLFFPKGSEEWMRWWALLGTALTFVVSTWLLIDYMGLLERTGAQPGVREGHAAAAHLENRAGVSLAAYLGGGDRDSKDMVGRLGWIPRFNIEYFLGIDGISMPLVLLTTALSMLAVVAGWNSIERHVKGYLALFLLLETGMVGTFLALDFFLFYIFWEVMLLPMYFLIGIWGGPRREYAAIKFFLYTLLGSVFILVAMLGFYFTDVQDFVDPQLVTARAQQLLLQQPSLPPAAARDRVTVNSFDLMALQRAGQAAHLNIT